MKNLIPLNDAGVRHRTYELARAYIYSLHRKIAPCVLFKNTVEKKNGEKWAERRSCNKPRKRSRFSLSVFYLFERFFKAVQRGAAEVAPMKKPEVCMWAEDAPPYYLCVRTTYYGGTSWANVQLRNEKIK